MKRAFVVVPLILTILYCIGVLASGVNLRFVYVDVALMKMLAAVGLGWAAARYGRREYLFWAWALLAANYALLGAADLLFTRRFHLANLETNSANVVWAVFVVAANLIAAAGTLMLARVWRVVGIALPDPSGAKRVIVIASIIVSAVIVGYTTIPSFKEAFAGDPQGFVGVIGSACDLICFSVIAPLVLRALAMRGGTLAWPWGLVAASSLTWLIFDVLVELDLPLSDAVGHSLTNGVRVAACALSMGAGFAQRWATSAAASPD